MRISDWSSDVCSSDLRAGRDHAAAVHSLYRSAAKEWGITPYPEWPMIREQAETHRLVQFVDRGLYPPGQSVRGHLSTGRIQRLHPRLACPCARLQCGFCQLLSKERGRTNCPTHILCNGSRIAGRRSEERRVGKECGSTGRYRWST